MKVVYGYKLFKQRKDGTLGSLFINARAVLPEGKWMRARAYPTKGYAFRPGWHATAKPEAPHLGTKGRVWRRVALTGITEFTRPAAQGGLWFLAQRMKILPEAA